MMNKSRRTIAVFLSLVMLIGLMPGLGFTAAAEASTYGYGTNVLQNPAPTSNDYWERVGCSYGKYLDMGNSSEPSIIGAKSGTDIAVRQKVTLTDADVIRANNGELTVEGSGKFYAQGSRNLTANLNIICYNAAGTVLHTYNDKDSGYSVSGRTKTLSISAVQIPVGTAYIVYEGTEHLGSGAAFFGMYDFSMVFRDTTAPSVSNAPYLYAVNGDTTLPAYVVPGDRVTYAMKFSEAVAVSVSPSMDLSIGNGVSFDTTYSADRQTVYFTTTLANTGTNTSLQLKKLSDIYVKDDAGNQSHFTYPSLSVGDVPYKSIFDVTKNLTNLSLSGASTVRYGFDYSTTLIPAAGYKLPESITVKVNGGVITDYNYNQSNGQIFINDSAVTGNVEITAVGAPQTYTVTFNMQGGSGGTESITATYTQGLSPVTPPTKAGYTFGGYYTAANGAGVQYYNYDGNSGKTYDKTSDLTLYAKWSAKSYTVTLDAAGGTGSGTITAVYDADMPSITKPTKAGYTFGGYFTQQNGGGEKYYNADGTSAKQYDKTDGLTLYAKWSANSYTVTFDMQGGSSGTASEIATYDSAMPSITPPTRIGYTFGGYYTVANGAGAQYYYANGESAKAYDIDGACTLYAKWTANTYDVVLNASGGSGGSTVTAAYDSDMPVIAAPDKPGYLFSGYFDERNGRGTKYYNADCSSAKTYDKAEGITLYALWTPITYKIQLYSRGEYVGALNDVTYGELRLPSAESLGISFANHNFVGWNIYDEQNWAMYTADRNYSAGLVTEQGKTAYIYAAWLEKDKYTVTYDANGGVGAPAAVEVHVDETITLSDIVPSRENYTFVGWSENSESASAQYQPNDSFTMGNSLVTLFAVWNKNPELTYNANGGTFSTYAGVSYPASGSMVTLTGAVPQKDGYVFRGWAESETAAVDEIISSPYIMPNHDTVLYAVYEPIKYSVSVNTADGYSVSGIAAGGYTLGEYAEFTVSGANPKVYINGILSLIINGTYKFEVKNNSTVVVCSDSSVNVVYNANRGINAPVDMHIYTNGDTAVIASGVPARTGYTFSGWAKTQDTDSAEYTGGESIPVAAEDIILYAVWEPIAYSIKYAANGGSGDMSATAAVYDESITLSENTFTKSGCQFVGWSYAADGELAYANGVSVKNLTDTQNGEITLYAVWKGAQTTVRFRFEGGSSGTAFCEAVYGKLLPADKLTAPNRYGYIFAGYYTEPNKGGNLVYNADMSLSEHYRTHTWDSVLSEFDLYAAWEPVNYTVAFVNGTETLADTVDAVYGQSFRLPPAEILDISVPQGHSFKGWSVASGSDTVYYSDGQEITTGLTGENGAVVYLYAVIQKNVSYAVTLPASGAGYKVYYNGNELTSQTNVKVNQNEDISFSISVEDGYSSDKMTVLANGIMLGATQISGRTYNYNIKNVSADTSVNIYNVKKDAFRIILNDGTGYSVSPKNAVVESGDDFTFTVTLADGYKTASPVVFVNGQELSGIKNEDVFTYTVSGITAQPVISVSVVSKPQHTVTFISNGGIYSISAVEENAKASQPSAPERYGYTFGGWYTDRNFTSLYDFQTEITNAVTLYAKWTANTYAVEYNKNTTEDVSVPNEQTKEHDTVLILSSVIPSRAGYTFAGWNTRPDGSGTSYGSGSELSVNSNITLYAQWKINRYTVTLITGEGVTGNLSANEAAYNETVTVTASSGNGYNPPVITAVPRENAELVSEGIYKITGPVSFVAVAETKTIYTASFYLDGGLYYTQSAIEGSLTTVALPNPPEKYGYAFTGWYTEQTGGTEVDEETVLDRNMSVYARFEANTLNVTPAQSGTGYTVDSTDSTTVNYGGDYTFTVTIAEHYNADNMRVYANGILLIGSISGNTYTYKLKNISANQIITVTGVELDKHTVTYMVDGQIYSTAQADYNTLLAEPASPAKAGKTFKGWSDGNHIWSFAAGKVTEDITLYAVWDGDVFTVTPAQSGTGYTVASDNSTTVNYGGDYTFMVTIAEHYNANAMKVYANGVLLTGNVSGNVYSYTVKNITADTVITVEDVKADVYTVTYLVGEAVYRTEQVEYGSKATKPTNPKIDGETFKYWALNGTEWDFETAVSENISLKAVWDGDVFTVTPAQSGTGYTVESTDSTTVNYGDNYTFTVTISEHYNANTMKVYANGVLLTGNMSGNVYSYTVKDITADTVITVEDVKADVYTVKYIVDGENYHSENVKYSGNAQKPKAPVKAGYTFDGWFVGSKEWNFANDIEGDLELVAKFTPLTYRLTVPDNQSEFTVNVTSANPVEYGGSFTFDIIASEGYNVSDMMVYANGVLLEKSSENGNTVSFSITDITEAKVITVRGIGQNTYAVTYRANTTDYVGNMPENEIKAYDKNIAVSGLVPERYGYDFIGWSTAENGTAQYNAGDIYSENSDLTLYAVWKAKTFTVSFETSGGNITGGKITEYTYGTNIALPTEVAKEGYDFAGWYEDELLQGARVYEIKASDYGDKKYYAAYSIADVTVNGYLGEYDGNVHNITYALTDNLSVEKYQWYFVPEGASNASAVQSNSYNSYAVTDVADSGEYYCYIEALIDEYVIRFFTERTTVKITKKPVSVKAADSSKGYDAQPLAENGIELTDGSRLAENHTISAVMTADSTMTKVGTQANVIDSVTILDIDGKDVTENYEITKQNGTLSVTPLTLTVTAEKTSVSVGSALNENRLYKISGMLGDEKLSLVNASVTAKNANGEEIAFADITKNAGAYTVIITYDGFEGEGSENYSGSGTITSEVAVYKRSSGGSGGGGSTSTAYTVKFDTDGGSESASQTVKANGTASEPETPEKEGYIFEGWYTDSSLTEEFDFATKLTKSITLYAKWTEEKSDEEQKPEKPSAADPTRTGVSGLLETERHIQYMNGYDNGTFKPENNMTRAEAAQIFYNLLLNKNISGESSFDDVDRNAWYYDAVTTLANMGIITGKGSNTFDPEGEITRAEFTAIAMRFVNVDVHGSENFDDVPQSHWAVKNISDAAALGWISGTGDGIFSPDDAITRASVAKIVNNMLGRKADMEYINTHLDSINLFGDVSDSDWFYADVVEATNAHEYEKNGGTESWK